MKPRTIVPADAASKFLKNYTILIIASFVQKIIWEHEKCKHNQDHHKPFLFHDVTGMTLIALNGAIMELPKRIERLFLWVKCIEFYGNNNHFLNNLRLLEIIRNSIHSIVPMILN